MGSLVAVDGGRSRCRAAVIGVDGRPCPIVEGPGLPAVLGPGAVEAIAETLAATVTSAVVAAAAARHEVGPVETVSAGLAGLLGTREIAPAVASRLHERLGAARVTLCGDVVAAHAGALPDPDGGVVLVAGTGAVAFGAVPVKVPEADGRAFPASPRSRREFPDVGAPRTSAADPGSHGAGGGGAGGPGSHSQPSGLSDPGSVGSVGYGSGSRPPGVPDPGSVGSVGYGSGSRPPGVPDPGSVGSVGCGSGSQLPGVPDPASAGSGGDGRGGGPGGRGTLLRNPGAHGPGAVGSGGHGPGGVGVGGAGPAGGIWAFDSAVACVDGWGHLLGDGGSGFWIGRRGLDAALRAHDGRTGGSPVLARLVERDIGPLDRLPEMAARAGAGPVAAIASFSAQVAEAAAGGDDVARHIWREAAVHLADSAVACARRLNPNSSTPIAVSWLGGLFSAPDTLLLEPFLARIRATFPAADLMPPVGDALAGAARLAIPGARGALAGLVFDSSGTRRTPVTWELHRPPPRQTA